MRRTAALALGLLLFVGSAGAAPVRANGYGPFNDVWVARRGVAHPGSGSSCAQPHAVADGVDDQNELNWAVKHLNDHGTLHLCAGTFHLSDPIGRQPCTPCFFALPAYLTIRGAGMRSTILDGGATYSNGVRTGPGRDIIWAFSDEEEFTLSDLTVQNAVEPDGNGAAVSINADVVVTRVRFYRNETAGEEYTLDGAALDGLNITVTDSIFAENSADGNGGAIRGVNVTVSNSVFLRNRAGESGGAIKADNITITDSTFVGNTAGEGGGALYSLESTTVTGSTFKNNHATGPGGAAMVRGSAYMTNSTFTRNVSAGVRIDPLIDVCPGGGGAAWVYGSVTVRGGRFTKNRAEGGECVNPNSDFGETSPGVGGALYVQEHLDIISVQFERNFAAFLGGAIAGFGEPSDLDWLDFVSNRSDGWGGALLLMGFDCRGSGPDWGFHALRFRSNVAFEDGGAIAFYREADLGGEEAALRSASRFSGNRDLSAPSNPNLYSSGCP
jgi:predicted outer membrane repeat protein